MAVIGYARVSSTDQDLELQLTQLREAGADRIFSEKRSGTSTGAREELAACRAFLREGDVLVVTRLDRLARSLVDLRDMLAEFEAGGIGFRCLLQPIDTTSAAGRLMINILGAFAEFETELRRERLLEGIAKAKADGRYKRPPRPPKVSPDEIKRLRDEEGLGATAIAKRLQVHKATIYRTLPDGWASGPASQRAVSQAA